MRVGRHSIALSLLFPLAGCAVVGPVVDADMEDAPHQACARFAAEQEPEAGQCVSVRRRDSAGRWQSFTGTLSAGDTLLALPSAAPHCTHGNFTHFVLEGASEAGAMRVAVPDGFGRGDRGRDFAWRTPRSRWTADNVGTAVHLPAGARVTMTEGQVRLSSACFKSYTHYRIPRARNEADAAADDHAAH